MMIERFVGRQPDACLADGFFVGAFGSVAMQDKLAKYFLIESCSRGPSR